MNQQRFDEFTRRLATSHSRRSVMKGVLAGAAAALFGASTGDTALASGGNRYTAVANERSFILGWIFCNLELGARGKRSYCSGHCVDVETSQNNCGVCGHECASCEHCVNGQCQSICNDSNACTTDICDHDNGECLYEKLDCDDGNPCTIDSCDPVLGCIHEAVSCDDNNACTTDTCDPDLGCIHEAVSCDDGNACTVDSCDSVLGCYYTVIDCDDNNACTIDSCDPDTGCQHTPVDCDDDNPCTADSCDSIVGCQYANLDGILCSTDEVPDGMCISGVCTAA